MSEYRTNGNADGAGMRHSPQPVDPCRVGRRGTVVIPAALRRQFGIREGGLLIVEARADGILLRPAVVHAVQIDTPAQRAAFLLASADGASEYAEAVAVVRQMGLDPDQIPHDGRPAGGAARRPRIARDGKGRTQRDGA